MMLKRVIALAGAATALAPHALTRGPARARRRPTCASSTIDDLARGKVVTGDGTKRPPVFTVEQLRRLARTRETIERRFEAPAVERPAEAQPKDDAAPLSNEELAAWFAPPVDGVDTKREEINGAASYRDRDEGLHWQIRNMGRTKLLTPDELALALLAAPAVAFVAPGQQAASKVVVKGDIGVDPGPITPSGFMFEDTEGLARRRAVEIKHGRISMMAFLGMMVQELGITFPGSMTLDGSVQFSDILKDGMGFAALSNVPTFGLAQILLFGGIAETVAMPASQYTGGPQNLPGGYDGSAGTIPGGYPFTEQITDPAARTRALTCELQNGRAAMLGTFGAMCHSCVDSCDHHFFYPITHN